VLWATQHVSKMSCAPLCPQLPVGHRHRHACGADAGVQVDHGRDLLAVLPAPRRIQLDPADQSRHDDRGRPMYADRHGHVRGLAGNVFE
jgi:hypothetical protein